MVRFMRSIWPLVQGWFGLGQAVIDVVAGAGDFKRVGAKMLAPLPGQLDVSGGRATLPGVVKWVPLSVSTVWISIREGLNELLQKVSGLASGGSFHQPGEGKLGGAVDGDKEVELASAVRTSVRSTWK